MATTISEYLYMLDEDLYRLGNATSPKLHNVRADDVDTYDRNGIVMVRANGKGISLATEQRLKRIERTASGYVWRLPANLFMPQGLVLKGDLSSINKPGGVPDHYLLCPAYDMIMSEYITMLYKLAAQLQRLRKL